MVFVPLNGYYLQWVGCVPHRAYTVIMAVTSSWRSSRSTELPLPLRYHTHCAALIRSHLRALNGHTRALLTANDVLALLYYLTLGA